KLFKTVRRKQRTEPLEGNRRHVVSDVMTPMGTISLDFIVTHEETPDGGYLAWWDAPTRELPINRGTIRISPRGANQTLFGYSVRAGSLATGFAELLRRCDGRDTLDALLLELPEADRSAARQLVERLYGERILIDGPVEQLSVANQYRLDVEGRGELVQRLSD